jgi:hypothetical protein
MRREKNLRVTILMSADMHREAVGLADRHGETLSGLVRRLLLERMGEPVRSRLKPMRHRGRPSISERAAAD